MLPNPRIAEFGVLFVQTAREDSVAIPLSISSSQIVYPRSHVRSSFASASDAVTGVNSVNP